MFNRISVGNTGGVNFPILASLPISEDLWELLGNADVSEKDLSALKRKAF
ncbi:hypothetical protein AB3N59_15185 [Leptospira sp. WS92.C1]